MENQNIFSSMISRLERRNMISSWRVVLSEEICAIHILQEEGLCLPKENLMKDNLELPRYNCEDRIKCKDFDIDKANFINFNSKKEKIVPIAKESKQEVSYCDMV